MTNSPTYTDSFGRSGDRVETSTTRRGGLCDECHRVTSRISGLVLDLDECRRKGFMLSALPARRDSRRPPHRTEGPIWEFLTVSAASRGCRVPKRAATVDGLNDSAH